MSVLVSRTLLGLADLEINDFDAYSVASQFLGGTETLNRTKISSPWLVGDSTTQYGMPSVTENIAVEIYGTDHADLKAKEDILKTTFRQSRFTMTVSFDGTVDYIYLCEAADVQRIWTGPRMVANQGQVIFGVPRQPRLVA